MEATEASGLRSQVSRRTGHAQSVHASRFTVHACRQASQCVACSLVVAWLLTLNVSASAAESPQPVHKEPGLAASVFGKMPNGRDVMIFELSNPKGLRARVTEYGAILVSVEVPDRNGKLADVALGFDDLESYVKRNPMFGATVGRYANRIANASFMLDGVEYHITKNSGANHIHGGNDKRFDRVLWASYPYMIETEVGVRFTYLSLDGEEGFPGNLNCVVTYAVTNKNELRITYSATTDKPTIVNFSNHSYLISPARATATCSATRSRSTPRGTRPPAKG